MGVSSTWEGLYPRVSAKGISTIAPTLEQKPAFRKGEMGLSPDPISSDCYWDLSENGLTYPEWRGILTREFSPHAMEALQERMRDVSAAT